MSGIYSHSANLLSNFYIYINFECSERTRRFPSLVLRICSELLGRADLLRGEYSYATQYQGVAEL